ncbi:MAG: hypothetical protein NDI61_05310 [Bdellovibrionaceae bacterium]|nr:hypothetical protein [Pseudobdellovibrionaceae bacterium]
MKQKTISPSEAEQSIAQMEGAIRSGKNVQLRDILHDLRGKEIPRKYLAPIAHLASRAGYPIEAMRLLNKIVRSEHLLTEPPSSRENLVYSITLINTGRYAEASSLLETIDPAQEPEALLYSAFSLIAEWKYQAATAFIYRFVRSPGVAPYRRLVGNVNLLAALVANFELDRAKDVARELLETSHGRPELHLLRANTLEISAQMSIIEGAFAEAKMKLREAQLLIDDGQAKNPTSQRQFNLNLFNLKKWSAIAEALAHPSNIRKVLEVSKQARHHRQWEYVRDCDLFTSIIQKDENLFQRVYLGTPYLSYRYRALRLSGFEQPEPCDLEILPGPESLPLHEPEVPNHIEGFRTRSELRLRLDDFADHPLCFQIVEYLSRDLYRPVSIGQLYSHLFPGEHFDPFQADARIARALWRARRTINALGVPLHIESHRRQFRLAAPAGTHVRLWLHKDLSPQSRSLVLLKRVHSQFSVRTFRAQDLQPLLHLSARSVQSLLLRWVALGNVLRIGSGRATRYRVRDLRMRKKSMLVKKCVGS